MLRPMMMLLAGLLQIFALMGLSGSGYAAAPSSAESYCSSVENDAKLRTSILRFPKFISSVERNQENQPSVSFSEEVVTTFRAGLSLDISDLMRARDVDLLAQAKCNELKTKLELQSNVLMLRDSSESLGLSAKAVVLAKALKYAKEELNSARLRLGRSDETITVVSALSDRVFQLMLLAEQTRAELKKIRNEAQNAKDDSMQVFSLDEVSNKLASLNRLTGETAARDAAANGGALWHLSVSAGYEQQFYAASAASDHSVGSPLFAALSFELPLGGIGQAKAMEAYQQASEVWAAKNPNSLEAQITAETQALKDTIETTGEQINIQKKRRSEIENSIRIFSQDDGSFNRQQFDARIEGFLVDAELAYMETKLARLDLKKGESAARVLSAVHARPVLKATEGTVTFESKNRFASKSEKVRATLLDHSGSEIDITLVPEGPTDEKALLKSGAERTQIGVFLAAKNQCNLLYVMYRFYPAEGIVVQKKVNVGESTHEQCGNNGYATIKPSLVHSAGTLPWGREIHMTAALVEGNLTVKMNGTPVWVGAVDLGGLDINGTSGIRTDNVKWQLQVNQP